MRQVKGGSDQGVLAAVLEFKGVRMPDLPACAYAPAA
jgi:hypothetical protein